MKTPIIECLPTIQCYPAFHPVQMDAALDLAVVPLEPSDAFAAPLEPTAAALEPTVAPLELTAAPLEPTAAPLEPTAAPLELIAAVIVLFCALVTTANTVPSPSAYSPILKLVFLG